jgi:uncharacterized protein (DUF2461 family)
MAAHSRMKRQPIPLATLLTSISTTRVADKETTCELTRFRQNLAFIRQDWLNESFLDTADPNVLIERVITFAQEYVPAFFHADMVRQSSGLLRHGLTHLLRGLDDIWQRFARCAQEDGPYFIPGLGQRFWGCLLPAVELDQLPVWLPETETGMRTIGIIGMQIPHGSAAALERACLVYSELLNEHPRLTASHLDALFMGAACMVGRELTPITVEFLYQSHQERVRKTIRAVRTRRPLRKRLADEGARFQHLRAQLLEAIRTNDRDGVAAVLSQVSAEIYRFTNVPTQDSVKLIRELYTVAANSKLPEAFHESIATVGIGATVATLHLADPATFPLFIQAMKSLDDSRAEKRSPADQYRVLMAMLQHYRSRHRVHPFEFADVVTGLTEDFTPNDRSENVFNGFCADTFQFFADLAANNSRSWMQTARPRYQFAVREPLIELCSALSARYVLPVLGSEYGWNIECEPRPGKALTSICKNDYGRSVPYQPALWLTFYPRSATSRRQAAQFFVRADADGLRYGFLLGSQARDAGRRFRHNVQHYAEPLFRALAATDATEMITFAADDRLTSKCSLRSPEDLRSWATGKTLAAGCIRVAADPVLRQEELVGDIILTFDRLVPLFAATMEDDPLPLLSRRAGSPTSSGTYDAAAFTRDTFLSDVWLNRTLGLFKHKRQIILQGLPGTGKTHIARCLARLLTHDRPNAVRIVPFHPGYGYAEFVESFDGTTIRDGVLVQIAELAAVHPAETFVLVIDEINRGHLPTVFGELLYLLEYRGQTVILPTSRRPFRLPENVFLIGTANTTDRALALDPAIRRRFAFIELEPDPAILAKWLDTHPPTETNPTFAPRIVQLFERLNNRISRDFGPERQFGHSLFMVAELNWQTVQTIWNHHVRPAVAAFSGDRLVANYDLNRWLNMDPPANVSGESGHVMNLS